MFLLDLAGEYTKAAVVSLGVAAGVYKSANAIADATPESVKQVIKIAASASVGVGAALLVAEELPAQGLTLGVASLVSYLALDVGGDVLQKTLTKAAAVGAGAMTFSAMTGVTFWPGVDSNPTDPVIGPVVEGPGQHVESHMSL